MKQETLNEATDIQRKIDACKDRIKKYERNRKFECLEMTDGNAPSEATRNMYKTFVDTNEKDHKVENEAYQIFLDALLSIEDEKLGKLEKQFDEL